jgi:CheY-like chemotaxis protein
LLNESDAEHVVGQPVSPLSGLHIAVVEDDRDAREMLARLLRHFGAVVTAAANALAAIEVLRRVTPDVVLVDMRLPDGTGTAVLHHVRSGGNNAPFIAVSAFDLDEMALRAAGFHACLRKPVHQSELVEAIFAALRERGR